MDGFEWNKIFAAILVAGIVASSSGFISQLVISSHGDDKAHGVTTAGGAVISAPQLPEPVLGLIAGADIERGKKLSKACAACHTFDKGGSSGVGPNLWNIMNRGKTKESGFAYSDALMKKSGEIWGYVEMNKFLWKPKWYLPGTKMNYIGMKKASDRAAMIAWLRTLSDFSKPLPSAAEITEEERELVPAEAVPAHEDDTTYNH